MKTLFRRAIFLACAGLAATIPVSPGPATAAALAPTVRLPAGFALRVFADGITTPRFLTYSPQGDLYVGQLRSTNSAITVLPDRNHDGTADRNIEIAAPLYSPNNVAFRSADWGTVFAVGELGQVKVYTDVQGDLRYADSQILLPGLPGDGQHRTKTVGYGPDGQLYVSVGSFYDDPPQAEERAGIWRYAPDGSSRHKVAGGLRNTVGFAWDAVSGALWGVDNGSDDLGRNAPHDELNQLIDGGNYGWPDCIDQQIPNPHPPPHNCASTKAPAMLLPPHSAPLGLAFYTGGSFPPHYWGGLFIAYHSSAYPEQRGVYYIPFQDGKPAGDPERFLSSDTNFWMGLAVNPYDGSLMVSDDRAGQIFQIVYTGPPTVLPDPPPQPTIPGHAAPLLARPLPGVGRQFPATGQRLQGAFLQFWFWNGGLARYGFPISPPLQETLEDGRSYLVQYTERARLEYHPEYRGTDHEILLGRLGADLVARRTDSPFQPARPLPGGRFIAATGHNLIGPLADYWAAHGGVRAFGYPLSEAFMERSPTDGQTYQVQYFERNRLEYHPENAGTDNMVLLGLLGVQTYQARYGNAPQGLSPNKIALYLAAIRALLLTSIPALPFSSLFPPRASACRHGISTPPT